MTSKKYDFSEAKQIFFEESSEMLEIMESCLLELEKGSEDDDTINNLFRVVHTIKGSSGMFGYVEIENFTHSVENVLSLLRKKVIAIEGELIVNLLECHDIILELLNLFEKNEESKLTGSLEEKRDMLLSNLDNYIIKDDECNPGEDSNEISSENKEIEDNELFVQNKCWHISVRLNDNIFKDGFDPASFINYLNQFGTIKKVETILDKIPALESMDPENCYLALEIDFDSDTTSQKIEEVFDFIKDDSVIHVIPPKCSINHYVEFIQSSGEHPNWLGNILLGMGTLTEFELETVLGRIDNNEVKEEGELLDQNNLSELLVDQIDEILVEENNTQKNGKSQTSRKMIKINAEKIDTLINLVGELVITGSNVKQLSENKNDADLNESVSMMTRLIEEIRDNTMNIRMVPVEDTLKKYQRIVRDISQEQGKEIEFILNVGDTELDKTLMEKISDPLLHLVRNAVDHGIDLPGERVQKGKDSKGKIEVNAYYEMGSVVIEVVDDGNGLSRDLIFQKAVDLGYHSQEDVVPDNDLYQLIFEPGFSTSSEINNISGRGVGMDVVKRNIESLRGSIVLESIPGEGTSIRIHLPLTLAIIDGFLVQVGDSSYVIPLDMVVECTDASDLELENHEGSDFINLRGDLLPFLRMRDFFEVEGLTPEKENIVVIDFAGKKAGLVIDRPVGEIQTVVKPLGKVFKQIKWISGATILGNGDVALILDVPRLLQSFESNDTPVVEKGAGLI